MFKFGNVEKYKEQIENLKSANKHVNKEKEKLEKLINLVDKAKEDMQETLAAYMVKIEDQKEELEAYRQSDLSLTERETKIIKAARENKYIYTVYFKNAADGAVSVEIERNSKEPAKTALKTAAKLKGVPRSNWKGYKAKRWEL